MTKVRDFVYNLAKTGRTAKGILVDVEKAFGEKAMGRSQVYQILLEQPQIDSCSLLVVPTRQSFSRSLSLSQALPHFFS